MSSKKPTDTAEVDTLEGKKIRDAILDRRLKGDLEHFFEKTTQKIKELCEKYGVPHNNNLTPEAKKEQENRRPITDQRGEFDFDDPNNYEFDLSENSPLVKKNFGAYTEIKALINLQDGLRQAYTGYTDTTNPVTFEDTVKKVTDAVTNVRGETVLISASSFFKELYNDIVVTFSRLVEREVKPEDLYPSETHEFIAEAAAKMPVLNAYVQHKAKDVTPNKANGPGVSSEADQLKPKSPDRPK